MIPGSLTQAAAAIFTLWFLGAVPSVALAQAIYQPTLQPARLARSWLCTTLPLPSSRDMLPLTPSSTYSLFLSLSVSAPIA